MFNSFSTALSALTANSLALSVTGDNLANMNTTGFKSTRVAFHDLVTQVVGEGLEVGVGVGRPSTQRQFVQGAIEVTGSGLDAAIQGTGFFVVRDSTDTNLFTRAGDFRTDANGRLVTVSGERVQGWIAANGVVNASGPITDIPLPASGLKPPNPTTLLSLTLNLDSSQPVGAVFSVPALSIDSLGNRHVLTVTFTKTSATDWDYEVTIPGEDLASGTPGTPSSLTTGTITFDQNGLVSAPAPPGTVTIDVTGLASGAADMSVNWDLFGATSRSLLTHYAQPSAVSSVSQDGSPAAEMIGLDITDGGMVVARFTGGIEQVVAQLAAAAIANPHSLVSGGNNNFRLTAASASPAIGPAGTGGRGNIRGNSLESSIVDIAQEFTNLIRYQRAYQANSRVVTTSDEVTQETLNLKR